MSEHELLVVIAAQCTHCWHVSSFSDIDNRGFGHCPHCGNDLSNIDAARREAEHRMTAEQDLLKASHQAAEYHAAITETVHLLLDMLEQKKIGKSGQPALREHIQKLQDILISD